MVNVRRELYKMAIQLVTKEKKMRWGRSELGVSEDSARRKKKNDGYENPERQGSRGTT